MPQQQEGDALQQAMARAGQLPGQQPPMAFQMPEDVGGLLQNAIQQPVQGPQLAEALALMSRYGYDDLKDALARGGVGNYDADLSQTLAPAMQGYLQSGDPEAATKAKVFLSLLQGG